MSRLLIIDFDGTEANQLTGFAQALELPYDVLCLGGTPSESTGAETQFVVDLGTIPPADGLARGLTLPCQPYSHIAALSSMRAKDVLGRLAVYLNAAVITDALGIKSPTVFTRPMVAGSIIATVEVLASPVVLTVRPAGFPAVAKGPEKSREQLTLNTESVVTRTGVKASGGSRPDLSQAKVIVSGGRPLKDAETFEKLIGGLADKLQGATGATRAAVDSGIAPNEMQVGQTGKIVAPNLYIAAGISGSTQHMAGIKDSKVIVAVNKDPDAPICEVADFVLVADLYDVIPELIAKV